MGTFNMVIFWLGCLLLREVTCGNYEVRVHEFTICPDDKTTFVDMSNLTLNRVAANLYHVDGRFHIGKQIKAPIAIKCVVKKCNGDGSDDSCIPAATVPISDICKDLGKKDQLWSDFVEKSGIGKKKDGTHCCPIGAGSYDLHQWAADLACVEKMVHSKSHWHMEIHATHGPKKEHLCKVCMKVEMSPKKGQAVKQDFGSKKWGR